MALLVSVVPLGCGSEGMPSVGGVARDRAPDWSVLLDIGVGRQEG